MTSLSDAYIKYVRGDFKQWPTWEPNKLVEIGTVGRFQGSVFKVGRHLSGWNVPIKKKESSAWSPLIYLTGKKSGLHIKQAAKVGSGFEFLGHADAGVGLELHDRGSALLLAKRHRDVALSNLDEVCAAIRRLILAGKWRPDRCVVTSCKVAEDLDVIIARERGGRVELRSEVDLSTPLADLAEVKGGLTIAGVGKSFLQYAMSRATPMFGDPIRVKRRLWGLFGHWYLVDPTGERLGRVNFPDGFAHDDDDQQVEWVSDISRVGAAALSDLRDDELFERVDDETLENDHVITVKWADVGSDLKLGEKIWKTVPETQKLAYPSIGFIDPTLLRGKTQTYELGTDR